MTAQDRLDRGRSLCQRLAADIHEATPAGTGRWPGAWSIVDAPSADFLAALTAWEASGDDALVPRVRDAYDRVLDAWRRAAERYREDANR